MVRGYSKESAISSLLRFSLSYSKQDTTSIVVDYGLENLRRDSSPSSSSGFTTFDELEQLQNYILAEMASVVKYQKSFENQSSPISSLITTVTKKNEEEEMRFKNRISRDMFLMKRTEGTRNDFHFIFSLQDLLGLQDLVV